MNIELNKIYQGDCLEVMKGMLDASVDLIVTDPPYGMDYQSSWRTDKFAKIALDKDLSWFPEFAKEAYRVLKDNTHIYVFCNDYAISAFRTELENVKFKTKRTLVWLKNNHTSGDLEGDYGNKTEFILYAQKGRKELNGKRDTNVLTFDRVVNLRHPTEKPVALIGFLIKKSSDKDALVLDPFVGSGTTAEAAMRLGRKFIGIELDGTYCEVARNRLEQSVLI